ncbi:family 2A encapsulin nanocompartment cargo protein cysteine desulfurase [Comamonas sp. JUb58]|uniref:family 2A encapsulin nanocompartment cargo protein cysteine desulfurase n=1 Tax=Comamonas sp. JUb58 TaxID=2485114 RepID=UPI00105D22D4|nr:family 2A encapsulin nanocompartment cargo protein cysteine desulfurase [Comamonas sp. JUb58]TDS84354.1 cysteine desulfurase [Comamonas sp. JUb58]
MVSAVSGLPEPSGAPISTELLAQLATALWAERPAAPAGLPPGVQAPVNIAPPGSPLASPAGLGPSVPGTPIPAGLLPGSNLLPASPTPALSLAHRAPALLPHAAAGNGVPDTLHSALPAYEPRLGGLVQGVPPVAAAPATVPSTVPSAVPAAASGYYFLDAPAAAAPGDAPLQALADQARHAAPDPHLDGIDLRGPRAADVPPLGQALQAPGAAPQYYFVHAVQLPNGFVTPAKAHPHADAAPAAAQQDRHPGFDIQAVRRDFPILSERINGKPLVWLDNAATTHKPRQVIERISHFYAHENSNIHRAAHTLAARATDAYEHAREVVRRFIHAPDAREVIFVRGTTEAINLVAKAWGGANVGEGDEIIISHLEHHANIVPWQQLAAAKGAQLRVIPVDDQGQIRLDEYQKLINDRTKIVAIGHVSNVLGTVVPVKQVVEIAKRRGITTLIDGAQSIAHTPVDVQDLGADFFVFSGHKIFAPTGIGVLWGRREVLEAMPPWQGGGNMIADVTFEKTVYQPLPNTFEAGTGNIADAVGLGAALEYVERIGIAQISRYEHALVDYGMAQLASIAGLRLIGTVPGKASVLAFTLDGYSTDEVGQALNAEGIAVRTGHHCAQPILRRFGVETAVRPSLAFYNTFDEVDQLVREVRKLAARRR